MPYQSIPQDRQRGLFIGVFYVLLAIALAYMLFKIWPPVPWPSDLDLQRQFLSRALTDCGYPPPSPTPSPSPAESSKEAAERTSAAAASIPINFFGKCVTTTFDERLILLVIVAGMLGSFIHGSTSLADYIGNDSFNRKWTWFYLLRPVIGMALALVFYFVIRGGFLTTSVGATDINPYGIAALAGLVGMFSKQATDKLSEVFSTLFKSASGEGDEKRKDSLTSRAPTITIENVDPSEVVAGSADQKIAVTGTNFVDGATINLDDSPLETTFESANLLTAQVPEATIAVPGALKLTVVNPDGTTSASVDFKVSATGSASPTIEGVNPAQVVAGSKAQEITVAGANFVDGAKVYLNDSAQETTFESATGLTAQLAPEITAVAGTLKLKVVNPDGSQSAPTDFVVLTG